MHQNALEFRWFSEDDLVNGSGICSNGRHFRRQQIIDGFIVDFYCHAAGLVIEVDGKIHEDQIEYDAERDRILKQRELQILRFTNAEIRANLDAVLRSIKTYVNQQSI